MKVGDLICYNAAGMKYKTLGIVIELKDDTDVLVMWGVAGDLMPRKSWGGGLNEHKSMLDWHSKIHSGDIVWHQLGSWFEVINESR